MRERLLQWLACPSCEGEFTLESSHREHNEIIEGALHCSCGDIFPIISGVPRLLSDTILKELPQQYPEFFHRHSNIFDDQLVCEDSHLSKQKQATIYRFSYEWTHFSYYNADNFKHFIAPLPDNFFEGKYLVENVKPYYTPLIPGKERGRHIYWSNFNLCYNFRL